MSEYQSNNVSGFMCGGKAIEPQPINFKEFLEDSQVRFYNCTVIIDEQSGQKKLHPDDKFAGWQEWTYNECLDKRKRHQCLRHDTHFCHLKGSGIGVIDIDIDEKKYPNELQQVVNEYLEEFGGFVRRSTRGKRHLYFRVHHDDPCKNVAPWRKTPWGDIDLCYNTLYEPMTKDNDAYPHRLQVFTKFPKPENKVERVNHTKKNSKLTSEQLDIIDLISKEYLENRDSWYRIMIALYSETDDIDLCDTLSQKADNYVSREDVERTILSFKKLNCSWGTIQYYARQSDENAYQQIRANYTNFDDIEFVTDSDLAKKIIELNKDEFRYDNVVKDLFVKNKYNIWRICEKDKTEVINIIEPTLLPIVDIKLKTFKGKKEKSLEDSEKAERKKWLSVRNKICSSTGMKSIADVIYYKLKTSGKHYKFNLTSPDLFAFSNGKAFDLTTGELVDIKASDNISMTCDKPYIEMSDKEYKEVDKIFKPIEDQIFPNEPEKKKSWYSALRTFLSGRKIEKFFTAEGDGRNGKGLYMTYLENVMGSYFFTGKNTLITEDESVGADPSVANLDCVRFCNLSEPPKHKSLVMSRVKQLTGETLINARGLYSNNTTVNLIAKFMVQTNHAPKFDEDMSRALKERIIRFTFTSTFVSNPDEVDHDNHFYLENPELKREEFLEKIRMYFIIKLVKHTPKQLYIPACVRATTDELILDNDHVWTWFNDNCNFTDEERIKTMKQKDYHYLTFVEISKKIRQHNKNLTSNQVRRMLKTHPRLKHFVSDINPKTRKPGMSLLHVTWKNPYSEFSL